MSEQEFKMGDKVEVRDTLNRDWRPAVYVGESSILNYPHSVVFFDCNGKVIRTEDFRFCRYYKEPKKRIMTFFEFCDRMKDKGCFYKYTEGSVYSQYVGSEEEYSSESHEFQITYDSGKTWHPLEVEDK